jgi:hypothetical protein
MAVDRVADFVLSGIMNRFGYPDIENYDGRRNRVNMDAMLERDFTHNIIEIPAFCYSSSAATFINMLLPSVKREKIVNSILSVERPIERRQINTILKDFTLRGYDSRMAKVINKNRTYCGWPGLITDGDLNTIICLKVRIKTNGVRLKVTDYICYVSPSVFTNQEGIIEKTIYKKIIPFCSSYVLHNNIEDLRYRNYDFIEYDWEGKHIEVVIRDKEECFTKAITPSVRDFQSDDLLKHILLENLDSLV